MEGLIAAIFKSLGSLLSGTAAGGTATAAKSSLASLKPVSGAAANYASQGVDPSAWTKPQEAPAGSNSPAMGSLIGAGLANGGRGGKGRQQSEQMAQAFAMPLDMSQAINPMNMLAQMQNMQRPQSSAQQPYALPPSLIQYMLQLGNRR